MTPVLDSKDKIKQNCEHSGLQYGYEYQRSTGCLEDSGEKQLTVGAADPGAMHAVRTVVTAGTRILGLFWI